MKWSSTSIARPLDGQVTDVADRRFHVVVVAEEARDGAGFGRGLDDHQWLGHARVEKAMRCPAVNTDRTSVRSRRRLRGWPAPPLGARPDGVSMVLTPSTRSQRDRLVRLGVMILSPRFPIAGDPRHAGELAGGDGVRRDLDRRSAVRRGPATHHLPEGRHQRPPVRGGDLRAAGGLGGSGTASARPPSPPARPRPSS